MLDDFGFPDVPPTADELDLSQLPVQQAAQQKPPSKKADLARILRLVAMMPLAMKAGPGAVRGLLQGANQASAARTAQGNVDARLAQQQAQQQAQQTSLDSYRTAQIENATRTRQQALLTDFKGAIDQVDDAEAVRALVTLYGQQATALGIPPAALEQYAMTVAKPDAMQRKAAEKRINALKGQYGTDKWMEMGAQFTHRVGSEDVPFDELLRRAGQTRDPNAPKAAPQSAIASDVPLDRQHAMAVAAGNEPLAKQIEEAMRRQDAAKSHPADPQLAELNRQIAQMRLDTLRNASGQGREPTARETALFNQIAGAYQRSPLVNAADRTVTLSDAVRGIREDPTDPARQMALAYGYIQALDSYQSAVREGELGNLGRLATQWEQLRVAVNRTVVEGAFMPAATAKNVADNAERLVNSLNVAAKRKRAEFGARAQTSGIGDLWADFTGRIDGAQGGGPAPAPRAPTNRDRVLPPSRRGDATPRVNPFREPNAGSR